MKHNQREKEAPQMLLRPPKTFKIYKTYKMIQSARNTPNKSAVKKKKLTPHKTSKRPTEHTKPTRGCSSLQTGDKLAKKRLAKYQLALAREQLVYCSHYTSPPEKLLLFSREKPSAGLLCTSG